MDFSYRTVNSFFQEKLDDLQCLEETKAYIISIFGKYSDARFDFSHHNATLLFAQARANHNFLLYQNLGDWLLMCEVMFPEHLRFASKDYYETIARLSYYSCYRITNRKWKLYEEIADRFPILEEQIKEKLLIKR